MIRGDEPPELAGASCDEFDLLAGTRVLDLTNSMAGPYASLLLADQGAEVIKVERPGQGDDAREWGPPFLGTLSLWFASVNRNKRSMTLDYATGAGADILRRLVVVSDVVMVNFRPATQQRLGVDAATLAAVRKDLIVCSITGFGLTGPKRDLPCYDLIAEGYSGIMDLTGEPGGEPQKVGTPAADLLAGMDAAFGITAALLDRSRTGRGHVIDVSLVESMTRFLTPRIVSYLGSGELPRRSGGRDSVIAIYEVFSTADEPITLAIGNDRIFRRFCMAVGHEEWLEDFGLRSNAQRREHRGVLVAAIRAILTVRPRSEWLELFENNGVPAGPVNRLDEVVRDAQLCARGLFYGVQAEEREIPQVGAGWHLDGRANGRSGPPPAIGCDTRAVLSTILGLADAEIEQLSSQSVV